MTEGAFPKVSTDRVYASEYNCINAGDAMGESLMGISLENSMNIAKLQYCYSVTDIPHNYLVVDAFTDSTGYNNTVLTCCTTSTYCSNALAGYYLNTSYNCSTYLTACEYQCCYVAGSDGVCQCLASGCFYLCNKMYNVKCGTFCLSNSICSIAPLLTFDTTADAICLIVCFRHSANYRYSGSACSCFCTIINGTNYTYAINCNRGTFICCNCITYCNVGSCNWDFYLNGACVCQVTCDGNFPDICSYLSTFTGGSNCPNGGQDSEAQSIITVGYLCSGTLIQTVPIVYTSPIKSIYLDKEIYGNGTILYNVIDSSTGCCIACNLFPATMNFLNCCVCCHTYEIVQLGDYPSCIKSYAVAVGV